MKNQLTIIIPAAGYGTRMGPVLAKELIKHPQSSHNFITEAIFRHKHFSSLPGGAYFHIISRNDKSALNEFVLALKSSHKDLNLHLQTIFPSQEWPDTVLQSQDFWSEWNLLLLPDADYSPILTSELVYHLMSDQSKDLYFFTFTPENFSEWGVINLNGKKNMIADKPSNVALQNSLEAPLFGWGLILFRKEIGLSLFNEILQSNKDHLWKEIPVPAEQMQTISLKHFVDLTRSPF